MESVTDVSEIDVRKVAPGQPVRATLSISDLGGGAACHSVWVSVTPAAAGR